MLENYLMLQLRARYEQGVSVKHYIFIMMLCLILIAQWLFIGSGEMTVCSPRSLNPGFLSVGLY